MATRRSFQLPRLCKCGLPIARRTAWTALNPRRRFLNCRNSNVIGKRCCDAFFWIDPELPNEWYKNEMIELYLALNPEQRYEYVQQARVQDSFELLQDEYEVYQSDMEMNLYEARKRSNFWKKTAIVMVVLFGAVIMF